MSHLIGKFVWFELSTRDVERAKGFYGELFGWKTEPMSMGEGEPYTLFKRGDDLVGGATSAQDGASRWVSYLSVADVDAAAKRAVGAGGQQLSGAFDVPTVGRMAEIADPTGARLFLFSAVDGDGDDDPTTPGEFFWNELITGDPARAAAFYREVVGYSDKPMAGMGPGGSDYHVLESGGRPRAGVMAKPMPEAPVAWLPYVRVAHADESLARAQRLGAKVIAPAADIPGVGRFAVLADPTGAALAIIAPVPA